MMQPAVKDCEDISSVISQMPFAPVSMFMNGKFKEATTAFLNIVDLARPLILNNIVPAPEAILTMKDRQMNFEKPIKVSPALLSAAQFDPRSL